MKLLRNKSEFFNNKKDLWILKYRKYFYILFKYTSIFLIKISNFSSKMQNFYFKIKIIKVLLEDKSEKFRNMQNFSDDEIWL